MTCRPVLDEMSHYYTCFTLTTVLLAFRCLRVCDFSIHFPRFRFDRCSNFLFFHLNKGRRQIKQYYGEKREIFLLSSHLIRFFTWVVLLSTCDCSFVIFLLGESILCVAKRVDPYRWIYLYFFLWKLNWCVFSVWF